MVVAGAGVIGLATARQMARDGRDVLIIEAEGAIGTRTSARNSEVIHAGLYYPRGSLKAETCVAGRTMLYAYLKERGIGHKQIGKLVVATDATEADRLDEIAGHARENGVEDVRVISGPELDRLEPELKAEAALLSPSTGIVDSHGLLQALLGEAMDHGANLALGTHIVGGAAMNDGRTRLVCAGRDPCEIRATCFVNTAGHGAIPLAGAVEGFPAACLPQAYYAKGSYFRLRGAAPFTRLIYPMPTTGGLGIHLTYDLGGAARFGPDVEWLRQAPEDAASYKVNPARGQMFETAIRQYWPGLKGGSLVPDYAGIRPKISGEGSPAADFVISTPTDHGLAGQVHLFGIESPGLTACLSLAEKVAQAI